MTKQEMRTCRQIRVQFGMLLSIECCFAKQHCVQVTLGKWGVMQSFLMIIQHSSFKTKNVRWYMCTHTDDHGVSLDQYVWAGLNNMLVVV